jgi:hypothetical protein
VEHDVVGSDRKDWQGTLETLGGKISDRSRPASDERVSSRISFRVNVRRASIDDPDPRA